MEAGRQNDNGGDPAAVGTARATVAALRLMIGEGRWSVGGLLPPQRQLAELLGISRATLREAMSVLLTAGDIRTRENGRGVVVCDPAGRGPEATWPLASQYSLREVYQFRHVVESYAAQLAAMSHKDGDLSKLRASLADFRAAAASGDLRAYAEADFEFHRHIMAVSGNRLLIDMHKVFASVLLESQRMPVRRPGDLWPAVKEHEVILEAIERCDPDGANYYMRKHIDMGGSRSGLLPSELP